MLLQQRLVMKRPAKKHQLLGKRENSSPTAAPGKIIRQHARLRKRGLRSNPPIVAKINSPYARNNCGVRLRVSKQKRLQISKKLVVAIVQKVQRRDDLNRLCSWPKPISIIIHIPKVRKVSGRLPVCFKPRAPIAIPKIIRVAITGRQLNGPEKADVPGQGVGSLITRIIPRTIIKNSSPIKAASVK